MTRPEFDCRVWGSLSGSPLVSTGRVDGPTGRSDVRLVLAEDSVLLREGLSRLLAEAGFDVVAVAGDGDGALQLVDKHRPDVAVLDIPLPPTHTDEGLRAACEIRLPSPAVGGLVLS